VSGAAAGRIVRVLGIAARLDRSYKEET
jgi:hypothetical protein